MHSCRTCKERPKTQLLELHAALHAPLGQLHLLLVIPVLLPARQGWHMPTSRRMACLLALNMCALEHFQALHMRIKLLLKHGGGRLLHSTPAVALCQGRRGHGAWWRRAGWAALPFSRLLPDQLVVLAYSSQSCAHGGHSRQQAAEGLLPQVPFARAQSPGRWRNWEPIHLCSTFRDL